MRPRSPDRGGRRATVPPAAACCSLAAACWLAAIAGAAAAERSHPVDCFPDRVAAADVPASAFGAAFLPGIVLGPPGDSQPYDGSFSVVSFGFGGQVTLAFDDLAIEDGPGADFIVFENAFFRLPLPAGPEDDFLVFAEPGTVEASADGATWHAFPFDAAALAEASGVEEVDRELWLRLAGLAGITPTFTGNWTVPDDPAAWDAAGTAGVSGAGGDAFDLADVGLSEARFLRITDADTQNGFAGSAAGLDLDAVVVLHGRPLPPPGADGDGDRLSDLEELRVHGSDPANADSDLDGIDDGREVASCRDPLAASASPVWHGEPRLWALAPGAGCAELRWSFAGSGVTYELIRGDLDALSETEIAVDLGPVVCLDGAATGLRHACDAELPLPGAGFFYLVRATGTGWGRSSALRPRETSPACP